MSGICPPKTESETVGRAPEQLRSRYADHQVLGPIVAEYVTALPEILAKVTGTFEADDVAELKRLCHKLCGEAATFGFEELALAARGLEIASGNSDREGMRRAHLSLMDCAQRIAV